MGNSVAGELVIPDAGGSPGEKTMDQQLPDAIADCLTGVGKRIELQDD